ncbi:hypothetical protein SAY87_026777 [Trapa incisa]|uniref:Translin n=1 Tax=Trapa incisa TaxID=236973 RepID=A0AAN7GYC8_9MYRT|nr:hypothetical protein SAY87_026777 [Trapa incisa]
MKAVFRNAYGSFSHSLNPRASDLTTVLSPAFAIILTRPLRSPAPHFSAATSPRRRSAAFCSAPMASGDPSAPALEKQFEAFRVQLEESGSLKDRIRAVAMDIDSAARLMHSCLLLVHQSRPLPEVLDKAKAQIGLIKDHYSRLAEILHECSGQYYRYHGDWRSETQTVVSLLALMHWLETGNLLMHDETGEKLGCMWYMC